VSKKERGEIEKRFFFYYKKEKVCNKHTHTHKIEVKGRDEL